MTWSVKLYVCILCIPAFLDLLNLDLQLVVLCSLSENCAVSLHAVTIYCPCLTCILRVGSITALSTFSFLSSLIPFRSKTFAGSLQHAILAVTSLSICNTLKSVSKIAESIKNVYFCFVMCGLLYSFPCNGCCKTSVSFGTMMEKQLTSMRVFR